MSVANEATADEATKKGSGKMMSHPDVKLPSYIGQSITSFLVFIMAATMRGNSITCRTVIHQFDIPIEEHVSKKNYRYWSIFNGNSKEKSSFPTAKTF